jgi:hypothetical protein
MAHVEVLRGVLGPTTRIADGGRKEEGSGRPRRLLPAPMCGECRKESRSRSVLCGAEATRGGPQAAHGRALAPWRKVGLRSGDALHRVGEAQPRARRGARRRAREVLVREGVRRANGATRSGPAAPRSILRGTRHAPRQTRAPSSKPSEGSPHLCGPITHRSGFSCVARVYSFCGADAFGQG